jgi:hypothetical protein
MVMATVRIGEHVQTMCRQAAAVDLVEKSAIPIANWYEAVAVAVAAVG